jgi:hypothetical protein
LSKIAGITGIETNVKNRTCSFKVVQPGLDYEAKLAQLAKTNSHLEDYEIQ